MTAMDKMLLHVAIVAVGLLGFAAAKESNATTKLPTVSLFLPMGSPDRIEASVISANLSQTAYELACAKANTTSCQYVTPVTVTEGESTVRFTDSYEGDDKTKTALPLTVECQLVGANISETPIQGATSAICTARSAIPGLGLAASTSTLAKTEINYVPVTITAGIEKLAAATASATAPATSTAVAGGSSRTRTAGSSGVGGALLLAVLRLVW